MIPDGYGILLKVMKHGFTIGNCGHKSTNTSWAIEVESATTVACRCKFEPKTLFSIFIKSNRPVLIHAVGKDKTVNHNYYVENCLKLVVKERRKQSHQV